MTKPIVSRARITKRTVDATHPLADRDVIVWDTEIAGFRLRVRPTGRKAYELRYRPKDSSKQRQLTIGIHGSPWAPDEARDEAKAVLLRVHGGADPLSAKAEARQALSVADLCDLYLAQGPAFKPAKRASSWAVDRSNFDRHVKPLLGTRVARDLTADDLAVWQAKVAAGQTALRAKSERARGSINVRGGSGAAASAMRRLAAMLEWARRRGLIPTNPATDVEKIPDGVRERYLSDEEAQRIWLAIDRLLSEKRLTDDQAAAFRLMMLTGARRGEVLGLRWQEVDFKRALLLLPPRRNKTGGLASVAKPIHISPAAVDVLQRLQARRRPGLQHVFPARELQAKFGRRDGERREAVYADRPMVPPKTAWARVLAAAEVENVSFHTLRHSFASQVIADGTGLYVLAKMLGHARTTTTERYAHLRSDAGAEAANAVSQRYLTTTSSPEDSAA